MTEELTREIAEKYFTKNGINEKCLEEYDVSRSSLYRFIKKHDIQVLKEIKKTVSYSIY